MSARLHSRSRYRTVPSYEFKGITIRVYYSAKRKRFAAHYKGPDGKPYRVEKGTENEAVEAAKSEIRRMSDIEVQIALREESAASEILKPIGVSVIEAARLIATYQERLVPFGASLGEAVDYFIQYHLCIPITVRELVKALLVEKGSATGEKNVKDLRSRLENRFCNLYGDRLIQSLRSDELSRWINGLVCSQRNKRNYHAAIVTLFEFGKENGYLPKGKPTEIQLIKKKKADAVDIEIFNPDELIELIRSALAINSPALIPLLIQGLAGVRHEEIEQTDEKKDRLRWSDIRLDQPCPDIHIRRIVSKTKKERFVPLSPALATWLRRFRQKGSGYVYSRNSLYKDYRRVCAHANVSWRKNGLRKSYSTYDAALSGSAQVTAKKAGNSAEMVRRFYKKEISQASLLAFQWFSIGPRKFKKEVDAYCAHLKAFPPKVGPRRRRKFAQGVYAQQPSPNKEN